MRVTSIAQFWFGWISTLLICNTAYQSRLPAPISQLHRGGGRWEVAGAGEMGGRWGGRFGVGRQAAGGRFLRCGPFRGLNISATNGSVSDSTQ